MVGSFFGGCGIRARISRCGIAGGWADGLDENKYTKKKRNFREFFVHYF
jgi:hypothetical protein